MAMRSPYRPEVEDLSSVGVGIKALLDARKERYSDNVKPVTCLGRRISPYTLFPIAITHAPSTPHTQLPPQPPTVFKADSTTHPALEQEEEEEESNNANKAHVSS